MRIIIVDDESNALEDLKHVICQACDAQIACFLSGVEALEYLRENSADVAFLDIDMPDIDGLTLARYALERCPSLNIIFVTGYAQYALDSYSIPASGYVLKPASREMVEKALRQLRKPVSANSRVRADTFGNFEIYVDGEPLHFLRSKSKELLAYLIDRKGSSATVAEVAAVLFEDRPYDYSVQKQVQVYIHDMMRTLKKARAEDIIVKRYNSLAVNPDKFQCDYYDFLKMKPEALNAFRGEYMANYSWAEFTAGLLYQQLDDYE